MKKMYNDNNVQKTLLSVQKRWANTSFKIYSMNQIVYAFNMLPGKYQDLLLKENKDENDKANLDKVYRLLNTHLMKSKNAPEDIKINIKNIDQEEEVKKHDITLEDVERSGDRWVKPVEKKKPVILKEAKIEAPEIVKPKKEEPLIKEEPIIKEEVIEEPVEEEQPRTFAYRDIVLKKYIEEREGLDIKSILKELNIPEEYQYIIECKFENDSVVSNKELETITGFKESYLDEVVDVFYSKAIEQKKKKIYELGRK